MANEVALFKDMPALPADIASFFSDESNIAPKQTTPSLTFEGKVWAIGLNGEKTKLIKKDADGDEQPIGVMRVVILDYAKRRGRAYYEGAYDPAKPGVPLCWSTDGNVPDEDVKEPCSAKCDTCEWSKKGSKISENNKAVTACSQHRMVVVVPANKLDFTPLRLKLAITSDYDGQSPDHEAAGWYAFSGYTDMLRARQVSHTAMVVTKMKFDPNVAYPKVLFAADKPLKAEELKELIPIVKSEAVTSLLDGSWSPAGADGVKLPKTQRETPMDKVLDKAADKKAAAKADEPKGPTAEEVAEAAAAKAKADKKSAKVAAAQAAAEAAAKAAAAAEADDDDDAEIVLPGTATAKAADAAKPTQMAKAADKPKATAPVSADVPSDVSDLLKEWGD